MKLKMLSSSTEYDHFFFFFFADFSDVELTTPNVLITRISPSDDLQLFPVGFFCKVDGVAQELLENFSLTIELNSVFLGTTSAPIIRNTFNGTIRDMDSKFIYKKFRV